MSRLACTLCVGVHPVWHKAIWWRIVCVCGRIKSTMAMPDNAPSGARPFILYLVTED